jgi:predicted nucleotidyltransferase
LVAKATQLNPLIGQHYDELIALCKVFGISRLELFGSAATDAFDPERSDLDFLVEYPRGTTSDRPSEAEDGTG